MIWHDVKCEVISISVLRLITLLVTVSASQSFHVRGKERCVDGCAMSRRYAVFGVEFKGVFALTQVLFVVGRQIAKDYDWWLIVTDK